MLKQSPHICRHDVAFRAVLKNALIVNHVPFKKVDIIMEKKSYANRVFDGSRTLIPKFTETVSSLTGVDTETLEERAVKLVRDAGDGIRMAQNTYERGFMVEDYLDYLSAQQMRVSVC